MKGSGKLRLWSLVFLFAILFACASEAAVTLTPRVQGGAIVGNESHVYFGSFKHRLNTWDGAKEITATPVLWRVMSVDFSVNPTKATLLSHFLVDAKGYGSRNTWSGSYVQTWLNGTFLYDFSAEEKADSVMMTPSPDGITGTQVTLPSGSADRSSGTSKTWPYDEDTDIKAWFGDNDYDGTMTNTNARKTHFKGVHSASYEYGNTDKGWDYWTRSPFPDYDFAVWYVFAAGGLSTLVSDYGPVGVRPAFFLNLESLIFKSALSSVSGFSSGTGGVGQILNPYILLLSTGNRYYDGSSWVTLPKFASQGKIPDTLAITDDTMVISWDRTISPAFALWPDSRDFTLTREDGTTMNPNAAVGDTTDKTKLTLTFPQSVAYNEAVTLSYNLNTDAISFDSSVSPVQVVASFTNKSVSNNTPPTLTTLTLSGVTLVPAFSPLVTAYTASVGNAVSDTTVAAAADPTGATITGTGNKALGVGSNTVTVTVEKNGLSRTYTVTVTRAAPPVPGSTPVTGVTLNQSALTLKKGDIFQLVATISPVDAGNKKVVWSTSNPNFATVSANGLVAGVAKGTAVITAKTEDGGKTATCTITVTETEIVINLDDLHLENGALKLSPGEELDVTITGTPDGLKFRAEGLPDNLTLTEDGHLTGKVPQIGRYPVTLTVTAPDGTTKDFDFIVEVTENDGIKGSSSGGGCNAGLGLLALSLGAAALKRRQAKLP